MNSFADKTDQELVALINQGDEQAFDTLYYRYRDWIVSRAAWVTGDAHLASEVLSETSKYVWSKVPKLKLTCRMKTFLYPTIKHASLRALARAKRCQSSLDDQDALEQIPAPDSVQGDGSLADKTSLEQLRFVLGRLPKKQTEVLWLRYVDGLDLEEIAAAIEVPVGTVKSRLHYAEQALRQVRGIRDLLG